MQFFADLHIHIGRTTNGSPVKISAAPSLTFPRILHEAAHRKGVQMVGIVDCASPDVLDDVEQMLESGAMVPQAGGGLYYHDRLSVILAAEIGVDVDGREAHFLSYIPTLESMRGFSSELAPYVTNLRLSSQKARISAAHLARLTVDAGGFLVPAHVFTPHKGYYGHAALRLGKAFSDADLRAIPAVELGLSADTAMACRISDLDSLSFLSNSDAHSLPRIAREYNLMEAKRCSFAGLKAAVAGVSGKIVRNYGLDPRLGKYHGTWCRFCDKGIPLLPERRCPHCGGKEVTVGVFDRLEEIADRPPDAHGMMRVRPPYVHQVPLQFIPGLGPTRLERLLHEFGTEMNVLHHTSEEELCRVVPPDVARTIVEGRAGRLAVTRGGGGKYGRVKRRK